LDGAGGVAVSRVSDGQGAGEFVLAAVVPGLPQPLLAPERSEGWQRVRDGFDAVRAKIEALKPDLLLIYSTMWPSVIGHQIQADPSPTWVHVDELFHDLGSIPYTFRIDAEFAHAYCAAAQARGLHARTVAYQGFPIDTGSVVALKLLNPDNAVPACIVSSNVYSDRSETAVLAKAARDAVIASGKRAVAIVVTSLSNRFFTEFIDPADDRIHSAKDEEWNQKLLEFLGDGRLEDIAQLSREIQRQIRVHKVVNFKPMWWLSAAMDGGNRFVGEVHAYAPVHGVGAGVATLTPAPAGVGDKEYDEDDVETYGGDRSVLDRAASPSSASPSSAPSASAPPTTDDAGRISTSTAPAPVGAYPHARRVGDLLFLSGIGPRTPGTDAIPGGPVRDEDGAARDYDVAAQTEQVVANVKAILEASGSSLDKVLDVQVFLIDMDRDFATFNAVYKKHFQDVGATRTTVAINALPTPIAVEFKILASAT